MSDFAPAYPDVLPNEAVNLIVARLRGDSSIETACLLHAGWVVQGYLLGKIVPHDHTPPVVGCSYTAAADQLESLCVSQGVSGASVDWKVLAAVILDLLKQILLQ